MPPAHLECERIITWFLMFTEVPAGARLTQIQAAGDSSRHTCAPLRLLALGSSRWVFALLRTAWPRTALGSPVANVCPLSQ